MHLLNGSILLGSHLMHVCVCVCACVRACVRACVLINSLINFRYSDSIIPQIPSLSSCGYFILQELYKTGHYVRNLKSL